jgi:hypothetical protein
MTRVGSQRHAKKKKKLEGSGQLILPTPTRFNPVSIKQGAV